MNKQFLMKMDPRIGAEALRILRAIPGLGVIVAPNGLNRGVDALVMFAGTEAPVAIEFKSRANAATAWHLVHTSRHRPELPLMLIAAETTADARRILSDHGIALIDGLGNAQLELPGLFVRIAGAGRPTRAPAPSRLSGKAGLVAQALLLDPKRAWRINDLEEQTAVSSGLVHRVLARLEAEGIISTIGAGPRRTRHVTDPAALLDLWAEENVDKPVRTRGYLLAQTPRQVINQLGESLSDARIDYALTGAAAASIIAPFVTAITVTEVWAAAATDCQEFFDHASLTPVTEGHNVTVLQARTDAPLAFRQQFGGLFIVNRFRLYADLQRDKRRGVEQADHFRREVIGF
ncbi:MAG: hypothetical protein F4Y12_02245 [Acidimicrobiaceae bacterium]|nr:hypothetical protein [Acidimicrobiaceae bacterium]MYH78256.1 hypothetical protein [Acidimicrobiaceae bacterium]